MFYERKDAKEQCAHLSEETHGYFLITSIFDNYKQLSRNEFIILTIKWKKKIKEIIHLDDMGYVVNGGNIFAVIENSRKNEFLKTISEMSFTKPNKSSIYSEILELNNEEIKAMLA